MKLGIPKNGTYIYENLTKRIIKVDECLLPAYGCKSLIYLQESLSLHVEKFLKSIWHVVTLADEISY